MGGDGEIERRQAKGTSPCDLPQQSLTTCLVLIASFSRSRHTGVLFPLTSEAMLFVCRNYMECCTRFFAILKTELSSLTSSTSLALLSLTPRIPGGRHQLFNTVSPSIGKRISWSSELLGYSNKRFRISRADLANLRSW